MSDKTRFKKNQVVWAKVKGYPWWPSVIAQIKSQDSGNEQILVNFLNEESHSTLPKDKVQDFLENYESMAKQYQQQKKKKLQEAVEMAMRIAKGNSSFDDEKSKYVKKYKKRAAQSSESSEAESSDDEGDDEQKNKGKKVGRKPGRKPKGKKGKITQKQQSKSRQQSKNRSKGDKSDDEEDENSQDESSSEEQTEQNETSQSKNNNMKDQKQIQKKMESSTLSQKEENKDSTTKMSDNQNKEQEINVKNKQDKNSEQNEKSDQKLTNQNSEQKNQIDEIEEESKTQAARNNKVGVQKIPEKSLQKTIEQNQKVDKNQKQNCENIKEVQKEQVDEDGDEEDEEENENTDTQWSKKSQKQNHENQSDNTESKRVTRSKINNNNNSNQNQSENKKKLSISSIKVASKQDKFKQTPSKQSELEEQEEQSTNQEQQMEEEENTQNNENSSKKQNNNTPNNNANKNNQAHDEQDQKENNINSNNGNVQHNNNISNNLIYNTRSNRSPNLTYNQNNLKNKNGLKLLNLGKQQLKPHKYNTRTESGKSTPSEKLINGIMPYKKQKLENGEELQQDISPSFLQQNHDLKEEVDNLNFMVNYNELDFDQQQLNLDRITKYVKKLQNFLKEFDQKLVKNIEKVKEQQNNNDKNIDNTQYKQLENITLVKKLDKLCLDFQNLQDIHEYINFQQSSIGKIFNSLLNIFTIYKTSQPLEINVKEKLTQIVQQIKIITVDQTLNINQFKQNINIFSHFQTELDMLLSEQQKSSSENNSDHLHENEQFETPKKHQSLNNQQQQINQQNNYINGKSSTSSVITQNTNNIILNGEKQNNQHTHQIDDQQLQQDEKIKKMRKKVCIKILECLTQKHEGNKKQSQNMALSIEKLIKQTDPKIDKTYRHMAKKTLKILSNGFKHQVDSLLNCLNDKENSTQFVDLVNNF